MRAKVGDRLVVAAPHVSDSTRDGEVLETRGPDGGPPYLVRWSDGHEGLYYPGPGALLASRHESGRPAPAPAMTTTAGASPHVRTWNVRVNIFERGDTTDANVVLLADAPGHLTAQGHAQRSHSDIAVPEIGDEVAVARALRRLADHLLDAAKEDISGMTGESPVRLSS